MCDVAGGETSSQRRSRTVYPCAQADKYANSGVHSYATEKQLAWSIRWPRILEELRGYGADIICLQEVMLGFGADEPRPHAAAPCWAAVA